MSNTPLSPILAGMTSGSGEVTPAALIAATAEMTPAQQAQMRANIGATDAETSIPDDVKQALLDCFAHVAWVDDQGQTYYAALEAALYPLASIAAVYTQSGTVYDTDSLDSLKADLVVTAVYESGNTATVPAANYTLSGTLTVGTSTITVSYGGKTTTFTVTVSLGLDSICFGTKTYRDMFITDNLVAWFGDFENNFSPDSSYTYNDNVTKTSGYRWSLTSGVGHPSLTTTKSNSPTHSVYASTSSSAVYFNGYVVASFGVDYIVAAAINVTRFTTGRVEFQVFAGGATVRANKTAVTDGWEAAVGIGSFNQSGDGTTSFNVGGFKDSNAIDLDGYIDDLVVTPCPTGMTLEQATTAMQNYMEIVARGDS